MIITTVLVEGIGLSALVEELKTEFNGNWKYSYGDVHIFYGEERAWRTDSNMMTSVIIAFSRADLCEIRILSGGGGIGFFNTSYGAERSINKRIYVCVKEICISKGWRLTVKDVGLPPEYFY